MKSKSTFTYIDQVISTTNYPGFKKAKTLSFSVLARIHVLAAINVVMVVVA
jgi:hypothetical protein